ncbi:hypothetical protein CJ263_04530 [Maribacter cobaltidurans]|uniref:Uncharacterized protein n=1 Tax=Maribacter cobaltidurans TaxID=1178778 RepID=A0A223V2B9_9FLAO|nr:hypothetical protein CJ263_04530 [Maribacter cobaltidurans]
MNLEYSITCRGKLNILIVIEHKFSKKLSPYQPCNSFPNSKLPYTLLSQLGTGTISQYPINSKGNM